MKKDFCSLSGNFLMRREEKALFIVFEGPDGSGQSTQVMLLKNYLTEKGFDVLLLKEPTVDSEAGKKIRKVLDQEIKVSSTDLQELFVSDRKEHLDKTIIPALKQGKVVISDRYFFSTFAFGAADGLDMEWLIDMNKAFLYPDFTFFLEVRPEVCVKRIKKRGERVTLFEKEKQLAKVSEKYKVLKARFNDIYVIDGEKSIEKVFEQIKIIIDKI